jgi:hypothetical protein
MVTVEACLQFAFRIDSSSINEILIYITLDLITRTNYHTCIEFQSKVLNYKQGILNLVYIVFFEGVPDNIWQQINNEIITLECICYVE